MSNSLEFVDANGPQLMVEVYVDEGSLRAFSFQFFPDSEPMLSHWRMSDPCIRDVSRHIKVERLYLYGQPNEAVMEGLRPFSEDGVTVTVTPQLRRLRSLRSRPVSQESQQDEIAMEEVIPGLYASPPETLPFAPSLKVRAFLLRRDPGNLLVYGAGTLAADAHEVEGIGGVWRHYLNHRHEAAFVGDEHGRTPGAPLFCHENERRSVSERLEVSGTFSDRHVIGDDFEVIPIPGHTRGATAYLWDTGEHRCLFTGDTVFLRGGEWVAAVLPSSDREAYLESLELIRELDFDVLVPWVASADEPYHDFTDGADTRRRTDAILRRARRGGDA